MEKQLELRLRDAGNRLDNFPSQADQLLPLLDNPRWYYIHFCKTFGPEEIEFEDQLKHSILFHGGAIAEVIVPPWGLDPGGQIGGLNPGGQISGDVRYVEVDGSSETT